MITATRFLLKSLMVVLAGSLVQFPCAGQTCDRRETLLTYSGDLRGVTALAHSPDGSTLAVGTAVMLSSGTLRTRYSGGTVVLMDLATSDIRTVFEVASSDGVTALAFSPDGRRLAIGVTRMLGDGTLGTRYLSGTVYLYDIEQNVWVTAYSETINNPGVTSLSFSPLGSHLAIGISRVRSDGVAGTRFVGASVVTIRYPLADVNGDLCTDDSDLAAVLLAFGQSGINLPEDVNCSGTVDDADLALLLFDFGTGC
ncbi:MAG: hypothetical protein HUU60_04515 [Armatimonadetes bacterium]|nr:hypothetical protein [Armatimonadota bacterium]